MVYLRQQKFIVSQSGAWKSKIKVSIGLVLLRLEGEWVPGLPDPGGYCQSLVFLGLWTHHHSASVFTGILPASVCVQMFLIMRTPVISARTLIPNKATF